MSRRDQVRTTTATRGAAAVDDDAGRTVQMLDGTGTTTYSYDDLNRLTGTTHAGATVGYTWDDVSRLTALTYPSGDVVTRTYDDAGQLATVTDWADREFAFDWTDDGELAEVSYPNGVVTSYDRDVAGQVTGLTAASQAGQDLLALAYGYSDAGLMTDRTTTRGTATESAQFAWDQLARLDAVTGTGAGDVGFDAAGSVTALPDGRQFTYDAGRQLTTLTVPGAGDTVVTTAFTYDARGNRLTATTDSGPGASTVTHTYDLANRLTSITGPDEAVTTYTYDGNGLRATATTGSTTESFTWNAAAAYPLLLTDADHAYVYGTGGVALAQIAHDDESAIDYLHTDTLGSVLTTTDGTGTVTAASDYDEYGLPKPAGAPDPIADVTRFGYAGEYTDPTGYVYLRARNYDPTTTQFLTVDPLVDTTGDPFGYTGGNPLQFTDPLGLWPDIDWGGAWDNVTNAVSSAAGAVGDVVSDKRFWSTLGTVAGTVALVATVATLTVATGGTALVIAGTAAATANVVAIGSGVIETAMECSDGGPGRDCAVTAGLTAAGVATGGLTNSWQGTIRTSLHVAESSRTATRWLAGLLETGSWGLDTAEWAANWC